MTVQDKVEWVNDLLETLKRLRVAYIPKEQIPFNKDFPMFLTEAEHGFVCLASGYQESLYYKFPSIPLAPGEREAEPLVESSSRGATPLPSVLDPNDIR